MHAAILILAVMTFQLLILAFARGASMLDAEHDAAASPWKDLRGTRWSR